MSLKQQSTTSNDRKQYSKHRRTIRKKSDKKIPTKTKNNISHQESRHAIDAKTEHIQNQISTESTIHDEIIQ